MRRNLGTLINLDEADIEIRLIQERINIIEVGDVRQDKHGNIRDARTVGNGFKERLSSAGDGANRGKTARSPTHPSPYGGRWSPIPAVKSDVSPRILLMMKPADLRGIIGRHDDFSADEVSDDAAAINIPGKDHRQIRRACKTHIGNIMCSEIDFRRGAGPFHRTKSDFAASRS